MGKFQRLLDTTKLFLYCGGVNRKTICCFKITIFVKSFLIGDHFRDYDNNFILDEGFKGLQI